MKKYTKYPLFFLGLVVVATVFCCSKVKTETTPDKGCIVSGVNTCPKADPKIVVNFSEEKQTIHSFGASDAWSTKFIGKWSDESKKNQVADYLFSLENDSEGNPKGIGLSMWRFNIGAGSFEQGTASGIPDEYRREESFLKADGSYDWSKQAGQQWFLTAAKARGVNKFLAFPISPPVQFTLNNKASGLPNSHLNLKGDQKANFADFLVNVLQHFSATGTTFNYLSPFNEPQWNWGENPSQEGTGATNSEIADFIRILGPKLKSAGLSTTIALGEANQWNSLDANNSDGRGDQINQFFNKSSANYIGDVPSMEHLISAHSYFTTCPNTDIINYRMNALNKKNAVDPSLQLWQSEFGILGDICGQLSGFPKNVSIDYGLYVAKVIHHDLTVANVTSWQWWLAVDPYNYSDGLVYINDPSGGYDLNAMKNDGIVSDSKQLWSFGNFSRFIRPGMVRVGANLSDINDPVTSAGTQMISAYKDPTTKQFVIVIINMAGSQKTYKLDAGFKLGKPEITSYVTSATKNLKKMVSTSTDIVLETRSVTTLTGTYL
ncbi:glycoside hydrolase [Mucilaginibacter sp. 10I4]|uniref:glycoside hydrolase n=1 Tax=Mucilaginibacter sp. 10I4 TaxID=3048580 RepID=UPI002B23652E|nr:glycoside hydrolase [Mucilaginibacter sp. 10I4]MEB0262047.1 glycoside hydrolase [Mucilaginibacter sp. 10I4]